MLIPIALCSLDLAKQACLQLCQHDPARTVLVEPPLRAVSNKEVIRKLWCDVSSVRRTLMRCLGAFLSSRAMTHLRALCKAHDQSHSSQCPFCEPTVTDRQTGATSSPDQHVVVAPMSIDSSAAAAATAAGAVLDAPAQTPAAPVRRWKKLRLVFRHKLDGEWAQDETTLTVDFTTPVDVHIQRRICARYARLGLEKLAEELYQLDAIVRATSESTSVRGPAIDDDAGTQSLS